jgi:uncharacterized membrane protein
MDARLLLALHLFGVITWVGGLLGVGLLLGAARQDARVGGYARRAAMVPELGSLVAFATGIWMAVDKGLFRQPYIHIKLTLVAVLLFVHVAMRIKAKKAAKGDGTPAGGLLVLMMLVVPAIIYIIIFQPLARP